VSEWGRGTKRRMGVCRGGQETHDVGTSMAWCGREVWEEEMTDRWGPRAERENSRTGG
jgi:CO dehydrogenase/acetyl-CoA synthase delta subunit